MEEQKNAHKAAGNLLISANYLSRGTLGGLKGFVSARERSKIEAVTFCSAESKTNKEGDNGAQENDNPGGGMFNPQGWIQLNNQMVQFSVILLRINFYTKAVLCGVEKNHIKMYI